MSKSTEVVELDLTKLLSAVWHRIWIVIIAVLVFGGGAFAYTYYFITPEYEASALMYVNNSSFSVGGSSFSISPSEISAAQSLVDTYIVILKTRTTLEDVIEHASLDCSYEALRGMIDAGAVNSTEVFEVKVTHTDPVQAQRIANSIAMILPDKIANIVDGSSVRIVDYAVVPAVKSSPSYSRNTMLGLLLGALLSVAYIVVRELMDVYVRDNQYLIDTYNIPVLASIPDMTSSKQSPRYGAGDKGSPATTAQRPAQKDADEGTKETRSKKHAAPEGKEGKK